VDTAGWIVAGYAAIVSTASLAWQVYSWRLARKSRVEVNVSAALLGMTDGSSVDAISVGVVNHSDHPVRVTGVGLYLQDGSGRQMHQVQVPPGAELPGTVDPHDSGSTYFLVENVEQEAGIDVYAPISGWVHLSTGETVGSKARVIRTR
jgi:hypothetical protein